MTESQTNKENNKTSENMKKFLGAVSKSEELTAKIGAMGKDELNDDDLDAVAGDTKDSNDKTCACVIAGYGYDI